jgi:hypothetical protein
MPFAFEEIALRSQVADNDADFVPVANGPFPVIAGLDPAIHPLRKVLFEV